MLRHIKLQTLFLCGVFTALLTTGATLARAAGGCAAADFRLARGFDTGGGDFQPVALTAADFNGDGRPDLAATLSEDNAVAVLLNDGTGWFGVPTKLRTGVRPSAVVVADFNGDGRPDLAVANSGSSNVSILLGGVGGTFGPASNFAVGAGPRSLAVGDFNSDGKLDLAVGTTESDNVSVLLGDGAGSFASAGAATSLNTDVNGLVAADFNSDGKPDLAVVTLSGGHFLMTGNGAGGFSAPVQVGPVGAFAVTAPDINGDGKSDLLLGTLSAMTARLGDGAGNFSAPSNFARDGGGSVEAISLGDLDGDGKLDAAVAGSVAGLTYFKGDGAGGFTRTPSYLAKNHPKNIALGDFDGDGDQDMVAGSSLLLNTGGGVFEAARAVYTMNSTFGFSGTTPTDLALGDFNGDGRADMAVSHRGQSGVSAIISILLDDGAGGFTVATPISYFPASVLNRVVAADFNKDGKTDVAVIGTISQPFSHVISISLSNGDGTFAAPTNVTGFFGQDPWDIAVGEFNSDGNLDLVVINGGSQNYSILLGNGAGGFTFAAARSVGTRFDRVAVGDFDGDSKQDFVLTDSEDRRVVVLRNNGSGGLFDVTQSVTVSNLPSAVVVGDFNSDGKPDIAVAGRLNINSLPADDGGVSVLLNDGTCNFAAPVNYKVDALPEDMTAADFDGDNKLDLAVGNQQPSSVYVLSGDGAGAFSNAAAHDFPAGHTAILAHDFDGDTRVDLAGIAGTGTVGILFGKPAAPQPCLFADDVSVTEGNSGTMSVEVTVRLSEASTQVVKVNYLVRGMGGVSGATEGQDFTGGAGTLIFQPGETIKAVAVPVHGDISNELDETFTLHLSAPQNARLSDGIAKVNIVDDDSQPSFSINDATVTEGNAGNPASAVFTVTLSAPTALVTRVSYAAVSGTAILFQDFGAAQGTLFFEPGATSKTISVNITGDLTHEPDENFFVNLSNPADATIADAQGQATILDDDPVPAVSILDASATEVTGADTTITMSIRLSNPSSLPVSVDYATADDTATGGSDYVAATGTVSFNPGETQKNITLTVKADVVDEALENFFVNLSNPVNATIIDGQAFCQIVDNDGPAISVNDISVVEGQSGGTSANFTLSLSAPSPQSVGVRVSTANGTASSSNPFADYQALNRFVVIPAGSTTATFTVFVVGDHIIEPDETFFVNLMQPQDATIADAQGLGTITNDDTTSVKFSTDTLTVNEADGSVQVTVTRVGELSGVFTAAYATFDGTASERSDYTASLGTLRFESNETSKTITVFITNDVRVENAENFFIVLNGADGGATNSPSVVSVTINSEDVVPGPNPIDDTSFFVRQHYRDFLNRDADAGGLAFWVGGIESCGADQSCREAKRVDTSAAFFLSIEFQETGYLAYRMYKSAYGDATSPGVPGTVPIIRLREFLTDAQRMGQGVKVGLGNWQQQLEDNKNAYALEFIQRARFLSAFPTAMTAEEFVTKLAQNTGAALSPEEKAALISVLGSTPSDATKRAQALRNVAEDADLRRAELNRAFVLMQYYGYMRRNPNDPPDTDFRGWKFWLDKLDQFNGNFVEAQMVKAFIDSIEYRQRFAP